MERQKGETLRGSEGEVLTRLEELGIRKESQFGEFYLRYKVSAVVSPTAESELLDLAVGLTRWSRLGCCCLQR